MYKKALFSGEMQAYSVGTLHSVLVLCMLALGYCIKYSYTPVRGLAFLLTRRPGCSRDGLN